MALAGGVADPAALGVDLERSLAAMAVHAPFRPRHWRGIGAALAGCDGASVAQDHAATGEIAAVFDGHLDNGAELRRALGFEPGRPASAAELLLAAYARWGEDMLDPIIGRFACAVWDGSRRRLLLGCDALGKRTLHHWRGGGMFLFAGEPRGLFVHPRIPREVDEDGVAEWLTRITPHPTRGLYREIERVPGGHVLVAEGETTRLHRYWRPERLPTLRLNGPGAYAEALLESLDQAVCCRLPESGNVGINLSAGLDSSSIAALAARRLAKQGRGLTAFTGVPRPGFDDGGQLCDEGPLAALVAARYPNIEHIRIRWDNAPLFEAADQQSLVSDRPALSAFNASWNLTISGELRRRGIRTLLTGRGGNFTMSYDGAFLPFTLLRQGRLWGWAGNVAAMRRHGQSWPRIAGLSVGPLAPMLHAALRRATGRFEPDLYEHSAINPALARRTGTQDRARAEGADRLFSTGGDRQALHLNQLEANMPAVSLVSAGYRRQSGCDYADPAMDRRLVELCLTIPEEQFMYRGEPRALIRRAMAGLLPPELLAERRRGRQSADWHESLTAARDDIAGEISRLERSPLAQCCLDLPRLRSLVENWPEGGWHQSRVRADYRFALTRGLAMGTFLRRMEGGNG